MIHCIFMEKGSIRAFWNICLKPAQCCAFLYKDWYLWLHQLVPASCLLPGAFTALPAHLVVKNNNPQISIIQDFQRSGPFWSNSRFSTLVQCYLGGSSSSIILILFHKFGGDAMTPAFGFSAGDFVNVIRMLLRGMGKTLLMVGSIDKKDFQSVA